MTTNNCKRAAELSFKIADLIGSENYLLPGEVENE
jgi:hypothetical protein